MSETSSQMHHPEQQTDEIYMGNCTVAEMRRSLWKTSRLGRIARNPSGVPILQPLHPYITDKTFPWFIKRSEVEDAISAEKIANRPWSPERIQGYEGLLSRGIIFVFTKSEPIVDESELNTEELK